MIKMNSLLSLGLYAMVLAPMPSRAGEIDIYYKDLKGVVSLTGTQGNAQLNTFCATLTCDVQIDNLLPADFPNQSLIAGVEWIGNGTMVPVIFSDLVHYHVFTHEPNDDLTFCDPAFSDFCESLVTVDFSAYPDESISLHPLSQQPLSDGVQHELTSYFEDPNNRNRQVGLPPSAIHVFVTSDGANVPEPASIATGLCGFLLLGLLVGKRVAARSLSS